VASIHEVGDGGFGETVETVDKAGLFEVDEVGLIVSGGLSKIGVRSEWRLRGAISGGLAKLGIDGPLQPSSPDP
jgi:hypothetical protein